MHFWLCSLLERGEWPGTRKLLQRIFASHIHFEFHIVIFIVQQTYLYWCKHKLSLIKVHLTRNSTPSRLGHMVSFSLISYFSLIYTCIYLFTWVMYTYGVDLFLWFSSVSQLISRSFTNSGHGRARART